MTYSIDDDHAKVNDFDAFNYLQEAVDCYKNGAYRACVILTVNAVFHSLRMRFEEMNHKVSEASAINVHIAKLVAEETGYEGYLLKEIRKHNLLSRNRLDALSRLYKFRNNVAHPTGNTGDKREAEQVFETAVEHFLRPGLAPPELAVPQLLEGLANQSFFTDLTLRGAIETVNNELSIIDRDVRTWTRLVENLADMARKPQNGDGISAWNAANFLCGIAGGENVDLINLVYRKTVERSRVFDRIADAYLLPLFAAQPRLMRIPDRQIRQRIDDLLAYLVAETPIETPVTESKHPVWLLRRMISEFSEELRHDCAGYPKTVKLIVTNYWYEPEVLRGLRDGLYALVMQVLIAKIRHADPADEDALANLLTRGEDRIASSVNEEVAHDILTALNNPAFAGSVGRLRDDGFASLAKLKTMSEFHLFEIGCRPIPNASAGRLRRPRTLEQRLALRSRFPEMDAAQ
ncbi:HEPN domain-containing protein [Rhizobium ruizarguesonis]|uniref:hypothetical protein n=1 Tax=Rhizobium ruizarguesonis TaxID=2081791 RepID=UPI001031FD32|nr:hypothetical protein [Rhizobium ruizarguesonis]TBD47121.1 hypothetical protein ELH17_08510 [Rhizobium ruizarguesonis]